MNNTNQRRGILTRQIKAVSYAVSGTISVLSLIGLLTDTRWIRHLSGLTLVSSLTLMSSTCLQNESVDANFADWLAKEDVQKDELHKGWTDAVNQANGVIGQLKTDKAQLLTLLNSEREATRVQLTELSAKILGYANQLKDTSAQNAALRSEMDKLDELLNQKNFNERETYISLVKGFTEGVRVQLDTLVNTRLVTLRASITDRLYKFEGTPTHEGLTKLVALIDDKRDVYRDIIAGLTPDYQNPHNDLLEFVSVFNQIHDEVSSLKVRLKNSLTVNDRLKLKESVDRQYAVDQLEKLAKSQDEFQLSYTDALDEIERLVEVVEQHRARVLDLESQLSDSKVTPVEFNPASRDDLRMANLILRYFHKQGIWLDRCYSRFSGHSAKVTFHIDRNDPPIEVKVLNEHSEQLQDLTRCLNKPEFKRTSDTGLVEVEIQIAPKPKVEANTDDISKLWAPASKFKDIVSQWSRVRITGGSEAGKSPTAENVAVCILDAKPGRGRLYNPQFDSQKNYWTMPTVGKTHSDSASGIKALAQQVKDRADGKETRDEHILSVFDEVDSTLSESRSPREISEQVKYIIKQASHQNLSAIFIGQSANVSNYPGMQRTDWNSAVNVHIGLNAFDAIQNSNTFKGNVQQSLLTQAQKLMEYCSTKNEELGLQSTNPKAYRFALVIEPGKPAYFMELPEFGLYAYTENRLEGSRRNEIVNTPVSLSNSLDAFIDPSRSAVATLTVTCPACSSENVRKHGGYKDKTRFKCLNELCSKKTFTV